MSSKKIIKSNQGANNQEEQTLKELSIFRTFGALKLNTFRAFWIAGLFSLIGTWMQNIGSAWLMIDLTKSPILVALVQTSQMIPALFLSFIAGALADMMDRRKYMISILLWLIFVTLFLAVMTHLNLITPIILIFFTLLLGAGGACLMPAMAATLQDIVPRNEIVSAVTLNSLAMNISRLIGPALAGLLIGWVGIAAAFIGNALSYMIYLRVVYKWEGSPEPLQLKNTLWSNIHAGLIYTNRSKYFKSILIRGSIHFFCSSGLMTLLPLIARQELLLDPEEFGILMGAIGVGAIITGLIISPIVNTRYSRDSIVYVASIIITLTFFGFGYTNNYYVFGLFLTLFGGAWMICMLSFQVAAQMILPAWVRGRGLSIIMVGFTSGMVAGGIIWGAVANYSNLTIAMYLSAITMAISIVSTKNYPISRNEIEEV